MKLTFNNVNPNKLHDALIENGIVPILVESTPYQSEEDTNPIRLETWITFADDVNVTKVNEVVEKHNPVPTPQLTKEELLQKQLLETQALVANLQEQILLNK